MQQCIKVFIIPYLYEAQHDSEGHTAHHQETKTALTASGFSYVEGCWTCRWWTLSGTVCAWQRPPTRWNIYSHEWKRSKNGRMEQSKAMEYESRKASSDVL